MRVNRAMLLALALLVGLVYAGSRAKGQEQSKATISGVVATSGGDALEGVEISLKSKDCDCSKCKRGCDCCPDQKAATNSEGRFSLSVGRGTYTVTFQKPGFRAVIREVDVKSADQKDVKVTMTAGSEG